MRRIGQSRDGLGRQIGAQRHDQVIVRDFRGAGPHFPLDGLPVVTGPVWTTDAPYRETAVQLARYARDGILAVEMQAASLFAFSAARGVRCSVVASMSPTVSTTRRKPSSTKVRTSLASRFSRPWRVPAGVV
ncbi:MAG: hypothetical protein J0H49_13055 [Acidobacteria bacterium]|nr:hypothetical protein [Acidobacteriota bacterium]